MNARRRPCRPAALRHSSALLRASAARFGARPTVLGLVLLAFGPACVADHRAELAELGRETTTSTHQGGGKPADVCAVAVEANALGHHLDVALGEARVRAVIAFVRTCVASLDTVRVSLVAHRLSPSGTRGRRLGYFVSTFGTCIDGVQRTCRYPAATAVEETLLIAFHDLIVPGFEQLGVATAETRAWLERGAPT